MKPDDLMTLREAAQLAGRSYGWAWDRAADGRFERCEAPGRRIAVTARSVAEAIAAQHRPERLKAAGRPYLRLVVDNTK